MRNLPWLALFLECLVFLQSIFWWQNGFYSTIKLIFYLCRRNCHSVIFCFHSPKGLIRRPFKKCHKNCRLYFLIKTQPLSFWLGSASYLFHWSALGSNLYDAQLAKIDSFVFGRLARYRPMLTSQHPTPRTKISSSNEFVFTYKLTNKQKSSWEALSLGVNETKVSKCKCKPINIKLNDLK